MGHKYSKKEIMIDVLTEMVLDILTEEAVKRTGFWAKVKGFFESGEPKHPQWKRLNDIYDRMCEHCDSLFGADAADITIGSFSFQYYKENPKRVLCYLNAQLQITKKFLELVKSMKADKLCERNYDEKSCIKHVEEMKSILPEHIKQMQDNIKILQQGVKSEGQFKTIMNKLKL